MGVSRSRHVRLDQLTASAPVFDGYCFNLNFGHFTGASLLSHNVPEAAVSRCMKRGVETGKIDQIIDGHHAERPPFGGGLQMVQ